MINTLKDLIKSLDCWWYNRHAWFTLNNTDGTSKIICMRCGKEAQ